MSVDTNTATALVTNAIAYNNGGISVEGIDQEDVVVVNESSSSGNTSTACVDSQTPTDESYFTFDVETQTITDYNTAG